jgi:hypothetical protein
MERRNVPLILFGIAGLWIIISVLTTLYIPDLQKPGWMQVADILAIAVALLLVIIELELRLREDQNES